MRGRGRTQGPSVGEVADELARSWGKPFEMRGHQYAGEMFYSDVSRIAKSRGLKGVTIVVDLFHALEARGFWLHS